MYLKRVFMCLTLLCVMGVIRLITFLIMYANYLLEPTEWDKIAHKTKSTNISYKCIFIADLLTLES